MIPFDLPSRLLELPDIGAPTIVIATGSEPRHVRFALRMQQEFGRDVVAWFRWLPVARSASSPPPAPPAPPRSTARQLKALARRLIRGAPKPIEPPRAAGGNRSIFEREVEQLRGYALIEPQDIPRESADEFLTAEMQRLRPCFFLTLGGGLYSANVLSAVRGLAINQHAGYSPDYKGNQTTMQALYHRDLRRVAATVHVTTTGADAGPILRRSNPCFTLGDTPFSISERVVALGTELMIECVHELRQNRNILAFDQPNAGVTYLARDCNDHVRSMVNGDFERGWLAGALKQRVSW